MKGTIEFSHVSKRYRLGTSGSLRGALSSWLSKAGDAESERRVLWALNDVSFALTAGGSLGLIGPNGSGKTTTLKLLSRVTHPTSGKIAVSGRVSSLIELGAGFHPELTGRENTFLNGAILGLTRQEIAKRLDSIIAFSELERFIDTPVKRYSSGMYVRLGFAVAAHVEPDILLVDEVLAVGDASFSQKCMNRMMELQRMGTALIFVSHNMHMVRRLCSRSLLLWKGQLVYSGDPDDTIAAYEQRLQQSSSPEMGQAEIAEEAPVLITQVDVLGSQGSPQDQFAHGDSLQIRAAYTAAAPLVTPVVRVRLIADDGTVIAMFATHHQGGIETPDWMLPANGELRVTIPSLEVISGNYSVELRVLDTTDVRVLGAGRSHHFYVQSPGFAYEVDRGRYLPRVSWNLPITSQS
jgi:lipopolysaccharide transport system ATP-binding protein